jgi:predicted DNA-binding WGR domain protein
MMQTYYYWINQEKARYYKIILHMDMLNDWILTCAWGGRYSRLGNYNHIKMNNRDDAETYIKNMIIKRKKRGYELMS